MREDWKRNETRMSTRGDPKDHVVMIMMIVRCKTLTIHTLDQIRVIEVNHTDLRAAGTRTDMNPIQGTHRESIAMRLQMEIMT